MNIECDRPGWGYHFDQGGIDVVFQDEILIFYRGPGGLLEVERNSERVFA